MTSEFERLQAMYREMGDEHLQDLAEEPDDLTGDARMALAAELRRRGWTPTPRASPAPAAVQEPELQSGFGAAIPGVIPAGAGAVEQALEPGGEVRRGMMRLVSIFDGHELSRACTALEDDHIDFAVEEVAGDAMSGLAPHFELWIEPDAEERARRLLRSKMGLFPLPEVDADHAENDGIVGIFESHAEAERILQTLSAQGYHAHIEPEEEAGFAVVVAPAEQERALAAVAASIGLEESR